MNARSFALTVVAAMISVNTVSAADFGTSASSDAIHDWTGVYVGVNGGYGWADISATNIPSADNDINGFAGGAQVGFNYDFGRFVLGAEADINRSNIKKSERTTAITTANYDLDYYGTVRARAGYNLDLFMPYVTAGLAYGQVKQSLDVDGFGRFASRTSNHVGWVVGAGADYAVTEKLSLRAEYLYGDLGSAKHLSVSGSGTISSYDADLTIQTVRVGLNYKF